MKKQAAKIIDAAGDQLGHQAGALGRSRSSQPYLSAACFAYLPCMTDLDMAHDLAVLAGVHCRDKW
jgi:ribosome modulation factor